LAMAIAISAEANPEGVIPRIAYAPEAGTLHLLTSGGSASSGDLLDAQLWEKEVG